MGRMKSKRKYILLLFIIVLVIMISVRINSVNENRHYYETYRQYVKMGDTITLGDLQFTFGQVSTPIIKESEDYTGKKIAVYKLPIEITKKINGHLDEKNKFGIYESYKDFQNLALVHYTDNQNNQDILSNINSLEKGGKIKLTVTTDLTLGDFLNYYDDYSVDKPAYIVIAGPQSPKGIPLYYFKVQDMS